MNSKIIHGILLSAFLMTGMWCNAITNGTFVNEEKQYIDMHFAVVGENTQSVICGTVHDSVYPGTTETGRTIRFWIDKTWYPPYTVDMFVSSEKDAGAPVEDTSCYTISSQTSDSAEIVFNRPGIYYVNFQVYDSAGNMVASYQSFQVLVSN